MLRVLASVVDPVVVRQILEGRGRRRARSGVALHRRVGTAGAAFLPALSSSTTRAMVGARSGLQAGAELEVLFGRLVVVPLSTILHTVALLRLRGRSPEHHRRAATPVTQAPQDRLTIEVQKVLAGELQRQHHRQSDTSPGETPRRAALSLVETPAAMGWIRRARCRIAGPPSRGRASENPEQFHVRREHRRSRAEQVSGQDAAPRVV
jgi:hypothetical protein